MTVSKVFCTDNRGLSTLNQCTLHHIHLGHHLLHCFLTFSLLFPSLPSSLPAHMQYVAPLLPDAEGCVQHWYIPQLGGHNPALVRGDDQFLVCKTVLGYG